MKETRTTNRILRHPFTSSHSPFPRSTLHLLLQSSPETMITSPSQSTTTTTINSERKRRSPIKSTLPLQLRKPIISQTLLTTTSLSLRLPLLPLNQLSHLPEENVANHSHATFIQRTSLPFTPLHLQTIANENEDSYAFASPSSSQSSV